MVTQANGPASMDPFPHAVPILPGQSFEEDTNLVQHLAHNSSRSRTFKAGASCSPVQALDLVGQDHSRDGAGGGETDLERIPLDSGCDGTHQGQAGFPVVGSRTQNQSGAMSSLFPTGVRRKAQPNDISPAWDVVSIYHSSLPTAGEASNSEWRLSGVTLASISSRL